MESTRKQKRLGLRRERRSRRLWIFVILGILLGIYFIEITSDKEVEVHVCIKQYLHEFNFLDSDYTLRKKSDYRAVKIEKKEIYVSDKEVEEYVQNDLESHEETIDVKRDKIRKNDVVSVEYTVSCDGSIVNKVDEESFMVGAGKYNMQIENALLGKNKNDVIVFDIQVPKDDPDARFAGKTETVSLKVKSLYKIKSCELTTDFIYENYGYKTLDEYYQYVRNILEKQKEAENQIQMQTEILQEVCKCFDLEIEKEKVASYSTDIVDSYKEYAYLSDVSLEEYIADELHMTEDEFYQMCYEEGLEEVKSFLVIGAVAEEEDIQVTEKEFDDWCAENSAEDSSEADIYAYILKLKVEEKLGRDCIISKP